MKCLYCGTAFNGSDFGDYHDAGCFKEHQIQLGNIEARAKKKRDKVKPVAEVLVPDTPSQSLSQVKETRGRKKGSKNKKKVVPESKVTKDETDL